MANSNVALFHYYKPTTYSLCHIDGENIETTPECMWLSDGERVIDVPADGVFE